MLILKNKEGRKERGREGGKEEGKERGRKKGNGTMITGGVSTFAISSAFLWVLLSILEVIISIS